MGRIRAYVPGLEPGEVVLSPEESHHVATVLRAREGDTVEAFDGAGTIGAGTIERVHKRACTVRIKYVEATSFESTCRLTLAVAVPRSHRQSYLIEKCTELGTDAFVPLLTERGTARPDADALPKWTRRAIEACKQSERAWVPRMEAPQALGALLADEDRFVARAIAVTCEFEATLPVLRWLDQTNPSGPTLILVGPEGGWSEGEIALAREAALTPVSLGPTILRTETAAVTAAAVVSAWSLGRESAVPDQAIR
jgi:16S rRNA (uracil1498-N3)-methyltransferase